MTSAAEARTLGEDLFGILGVLDEQSALRRALAEGSRPQRARSELARGLFGGRVSDATLDLFASLCESRWSSAGDLADAVEELAVTAFAAAAERGRHLDDLEDQLFRFGRVIMGAPELRAVLSNPTVPAPVQAPAAGHPARGQGDPGRPAAHRPGRGTPQGT